MTTTIIIPSAVLASNLRAMLFCVSKDTTRAHLNSVLLEVHATGQRNAQDNEVAPLRFVATDGHWLLINDTTVEVAYLGVRSFQIAEADAKKLLKCVDAKSSATVTLTLEDETCTAEQAGKVIAMWDNVNAKFPPYAQVIPATRATPKDGETQRFPSFNALLLGKALDAFAALAEDGKKSCGMHATPSGDEYDPIVLTSDECGAANATAVVMPMRLLKPKLRTYTPLADAAEDKAAE